MITTSHMGEWPEQRSVRFPALAHIPVPVTRMSGECRNEVIIPTSNRAADITSANSYEEAWPLFATGTTVPEVFTRLFRANESLLTTTTARSAVMGYALTRRIQAAGIPRADVNAFLVVLATYERNQPLTTGLWRQVLRGSLTPDQRSGQSPSPALDNWRHLRRFSQHPSSTCEDYGLTFIPPRLDTEPWAIRTQWTMDEFMHLLLRIRPSERSLTQLTDFADTFVRSRHASGPFPGIQIAGMARGFMFTAPYISAPPSPDAFTETAPPPTPNDSAAPMELDEATRQTPQPSKEQPS